MEIYILTGYDSILDTDEVKAVFFSHSKALAYQKEYGYALEEHETKDELSTKTL